MRVMACALTYPLPNGVTVSLDISADGILERGHDIKIVSPDYEKGRVRPEHEPVPSSILANKAAESLLGRKERVFGVGAGKEIRKISKEFNPDLYWLHTVTWSSNAFESHMLRSKKGKILFYHTWVEKYGELYAGDAGAFLMKKRTKLLCNNMDAVMVPSGVVKEKLLEYGVRTPMHIVRTGVEPPNESFKREDLEKKFGIPKEQKILLYVGRISKEKNLMVLLDTLEYLRGKNEEVSLLLVGPGDLDKMTEEAKKRGVEKMVFCTGPLKREEVKKIYGACDVFVFPSKSETQGIVLEEAMASDIPVVALDSLIRNEIYPEGKALVAKEDSKFKEKVLEILKDKEKREDMVREAKKFVLDNFSKEEMVKKQMTIFEEVLKNKLEKNEE